jgi:nucleotide-binding universal stress UspA family protein
MKNKVLISMLNEHYGDVIQDYVLKRPWLAGTDFIVFSVVEPPPLYQVPADYWAYALEEEFTKRKDFLDKIAAEIQATVPNCTASGRVEQGSAVDTILRFATELDCDLVIMGCHSHKGLQRFLLGSVSSQVAANCSCSTLIIRGKHHEVPAEQGEKSAAAKS